MKVAIISYWDTNDVNSWSGIPYFLSRALSNVITNSVVINVPNEKTKEISTNGIANSVSILSEIGKNLSVEISRIQPDAIICIGSAMVPFLETRIPIFPWVDASFFGLKRIDFSSFATNFPFEYDMDQKIILKSCRIFFAADWLKNQTEIYYPSAKGKISVIPFGANIEVNNQQDVARLITNRESSPCQLLFIGKDWKRKGLLKAYQLKRNLQKKGLKVNLHVVGNKINLKEFKTSLCNFYSLDYLELRYLLNKYNHDRDVINYGFLDKSDNNHVRVIQSLLTNSHFLVHPAEFECYGIVMAEANAYGLPIITTNHFGPATIVHDGRNGYKFDLDNFVDESCEVILHYMKNHDSYLRLCINSFEEFQNRLNWQVAVNRVKEIIENELSK